MIQLMLYVALLWFVAYLIVSFIPMPAQGQKAVYLIAGIFTLVILLQAFGVDLDFPRLNHKP